MSSNSIRIKDVATDLTFRELRMAEILKAFGVETFEDLADQTDNAGDPLTMHRRGYFNRAEVEDFFGYVSKAIHGMSNLGGDVNLRARCAVLSGQLRQLREGTERSLAVDDARGQAAREAGAEGECDCGGEHNFTAMIIELDTRPDEVWRRQTLAWLQACGLARDLADTMLATALANAALRTTDIAAYSEGDEILQESARRVIAIHEIRARWDFDILSYASLSFLEQKVYLGLADVLGAEMAEAMVKIMRDKEDDRG